MSNDSQVLDRHFHIQQNRRAASQPHPLRGSSFARLFIPFIGSVADEQPLDTPHNLDVPASWRKRVNSAEAVARLNRYARRLGEYMRHDLETSV